jgi:Uma2 family endonuclease
MSEAPLFYDVLPEPGTVMTTADYLRTPESNRVHELWRGVFRVEESPTSWHQDLAFEIAIAIRAHVKTRDLGKVWVAPLDVIFDHDRAIVLQPDVVFVSHERLAIVTDKVRGAPDLVIEVLSPLPRIGTLTERVECFAAHGVRECWLVDQLTRTVEVLTFEGGRIAHRAAVAASQPVPCRVLPGLQFRMEDATG